MNCEKTQFFLNTLYIILLAIFPVDTISTELSIIPSLLDFIPEVSTFLVHTKLSNIYIRIYMYLYISRFKFMLMSCKYIQPLTYISISHFVLFFSASNRLNNPLKYTVNYNEYRHFQHLRIDPYFPKPCVLWHSVYRCKYFFCVLQVSDVLYGGAYWFNFAFGNTITLQRNSVIKHSLYGPSLFYRNLYWSQLPFLPCLLARGISTI